MANYDLNDQQRSLLTLSTLTTIGFGESTDPDRIALESQGLIEPAGRNKYRATPAGIEAEKIDGALSR